MKIVHVKPLPNFRLQIAFDDGASGTVDLSHLAGRGVFEAWNLPNLFELVRVTESGAVEWPGEIDLCPDSLYLKMTGKLPAEMQKSSGIHSHA